MPTLDESFIRNFEEEVHFQYQMLGSKLRNTVRVEDNIQLGHSAEFQRLGSDVRIACLLQDYYAGDWVDQLENLKTNINEQQIVAKAEAYALGHKSNELIINAMMGAKHNINEGQMCWDTIEVASVLMEYANVPNDGQRFAVVGWKQWSELLNIQEFADADYLNNDESPWEGTQVKRWLGTIWLPHSGLPKDGNVRSCFWYHRSAIGHAIGDKVTTRITWHEDRAAHFINNCLLQGACLIDSSRVVRLQCVEN